MFENQVSVFRSLEGPAAVRVVEPHSRLFGSACDLFNQALARGRWARLWAWLARRPNALIDLNRAPVRIAGRYAAGLRSVPLHQIGGTLGRAADFDRSFRPLSAHVRERWQSVAVARLQGTGLPAVSLIRVGDRYFVQDGHHRVSVARALKEAEIDADVTVWEVAGPPPWDRLRPESPPASMRRPEPSPR